MTDPRPLPEGDQGMIDPMSVSKQVVLLERMVYWQERELTDIMRALHPECSAFPGVPNGCTASTCDCFANFDMPGQIKSLRALAARDAGEGGGDG